MERNVRIAYLMDLYGALLTGKQFECLDLHYNEDLSLSEIAQREGISRQGVHDAIRRGEAALEGMESRANLLKKLIATREKLLCGIETARRRGLPTEFLEEVLSIWEDA